MPPAKDVEQLVRRLGSSRSVVYRDLKLLESIGYPIETDDRSFNFIPLADALPQLHRNHVLRMICINLDLISV